MSAGRVALALGVLAALAPAPAHAFSDPAMFATPVVAGGGGGRYFTGSRADGYACSVCHQGGAAPKVTLEGVPATLVAGTRYTLTLRWTQPEQPQGFQLELTTPAGAHPAVELAPEAMLPAEARCDQLPTGMRADYTFDVGARRIVGVEDCGAAQLAFSFVATGEPLALAIAGVRGDGDGTARGDGTYEDRQMLGQHLTASGGGGCDASGGRGAAGWLALAGVLGVVTRGRARRAR